MTLEITLFLVVIIFLLSLLFVAGDPKERRIIKPLFLRLSPALSLLPAWWVYQWLVSRNFEPLGGLGDRLMSKAVYLSNGSHAPIDFLLAWLGAPVVGFIDILLLVAIIVFCFALVVIGIVGLIMAVPTLMRFFAAAGRAYWKNISESYRIIWSKLTKLRDFFTQPPSIKAIRETLRSTKPQAEKINKIAKELRTEYDEVIKGQVPIWKIKAYERNHKTFSQKMSERRAKALTGYSQRIAETARTLREAADMGAKTRSPGGYDERG